MTTEPAAQPSTSAASTRVVDAVAAAEGTDPLDLGATLYDVVDPDALDALYRDGGGTVAVEFDYVGYRVAIDEDGEIDVSKA